MRKNQKAFTLVEVLLIVVVVGLLVGVGYYVFAKRNKYASTTNTDTSAVNQQPIENESKPMEQTQDTLRYENLETGMSFSYPKDWKMTDTPLKDHIFSVRFESPDYMVSSDTSQIPPDAGGAFFVSANQSDFSDIAEFKAKYTGPGMYRSSMQDIVVAGVPALRDDPCEKLRICVIIIRKSIYYGVGYMNSVNENETDTKYLNEFNNLVNSITFK